MEVDELVCGICFHFFDDNEHCPRMIPSCGHTFCSRCLQNMINKLQQNEIFTCPEDRVIWSMENKDINSFPKNFVLIRFLERRKPQNILNHNTSTENMITTSRNMISTEDMSISKTSDMILNSLEIDKRENIGFDDKKNSIHDISANDLLTVNTSNISGGNSISPRSNQSNNNIISSSQEQNNLQVLHVSFDNAMCKEHNRKLEIVCIDHRCRICTNCALFGSHKNHEIRAEEEVLRDVAQRAECLIDIFSLIEINQNKLFDQQFIDYLNSKLKSKYDEVAKVIQEKFNSYIEVIRARERKILDEINRKFSIMEEKFKEIRQLPSDLYEKINKWKNIAQDKLTILSEKTERNEITFELLEDRYNLKNDILVTGEKLVQELERTNEIPVKSLEDALNGISIIFNDNFTNIVDTLCALVFNTDITINNNNNNPSSSSTSTSSSTSSSWKYGISNAYDNQGFLKPVSNVFNMNSNNGGGCNMMMGNNNNSYNNNNQGMTNRTHFKNNIDFTKVRKSIDFFNEKLERMAEEGSKFDQMDVMNKISITRRLDEDNDLLHMDINNFHISDMSDIADNRAKQTNFKPTFTFSTAPTDNSNNNSMNQGQNFLNSNVNANDNKNLPIYISPPIDPEESKSKASFSMIMPKPKESDKDVTTNKANPKKKPNMRFPEKYENIIEGLKMGNLENVDLTGAEIGDVGLAYLSDYIASNKQMKYLKLVRNKLTDEGGAILIKALEKNITLQTLNLTQNALTDKTFDGFVNLFKTNASIKTIYFNQNAIGQRNAKNKIKDLAKLGINVNIQISISFDQMHLNNIHKMIQIIRFHSISKQYIPLVPKYLELLSINKKKRS